jgi:heme oxygenase
VVTVEVSKLLKEGTKQAHRAAENVHYVKEFVRGRVSREVYRRMVANLYFVYKALEDAFDDHASSSSQTLSQIPSQTSESLSSQSSSESQHSHSHSPPHPLLAPVYFPKELHRASALEEDLAFYYGANWRELTEEIVAEEEEEEEEEEDVSDDGADDGANDGAASRAATVGSVTAKEAVTARKKMVTRVVPLVRPSPVAQAYVARLHELSSGNNPELLVPHAYTRYLGDLSGGQVC